MTDKKEQVEPKEPPVEPKDVPAEPKEPKPEVPFHLTEEGGATAFGPGTPKK